MKRIVTIVLMAISGMACSQQSEPGDRRMDSREHRPDIDSTPKPAVIADNKPPPEPSRENTRLDMNAAISKFAPGWMVKDCGDTMSPGIRDALGRKNVLVTHPLGADAPCVIGRRVDIVPNKKTVLHLVAGHHPDGDWLLIVTADRELVRKVIGKETAPDGWANIDVDLSSYAGQIITLQLINAVNPGTPGAHQEAYWARIEIE